METSIESSEVGTSGLNHKPLSRREHNRRFRAAMAKARTVRAAKTAPTSINPAVAELERIYNALAPRFGLDTQPRPVIVIQRRGRRKARGWLAPHAWQQRGTSVNELTLTAEDLKDGADAAVSTLCHEMVHHANAVEGVKDCSANQYHNAQFRDRARAFGLHVEKLRGYGWAQTSPGPELAEVIHRLRVNASVFNIFRTMRAREKAPTKMKKWTCGCTIVRCAVELEAGCYRCRRPGETDEQWEDRRRLLRELGTPFTKAE